MTGVRNSHQIVLAGSVLHLILASGCTKPPERPTSAPQDSSSAAPTVDASPQTSRVAPAPPETSPFIGSRGAFVLVGEESTLVVPVDPLRPVRELDGLWAGDLVPKRSGVGRGWTRVKYVPGDDDPILRVCPRSQPDSGCRIEVEAKQSARKTVETMGRQMLARYHVYGLGYREVRVADPQTGSVCECIPVEGISNDVPSRPLPAPDERSLLAVPGVRLERPAGELPSAATGREAAATCNSSLDACGSPEAFGSTKGADAWWVSADEVFALTDTGGTLQLWAGGSDRPIREHAHKTDPPPLAVEFHLDSVLHDVDNPSGVTTLGFGALHERDADFSGSAEAWAKRCGGHLAMMRFDAAETACLLGLHAGGSNAVRTTLTQMLGEIEDGRYDWERALEYYRRSEELGPGDPEVRARIEKLEKN